MGHIRLGRLPHSLKWGEVLQLLTDSPSDAAAISRATALAAEHHLQQLAHDSSLTYCFWLIARVTWAARSDQFLNELRSLDIAVDSATPTLGFIAALTDHARTQMIENPESGATSELASLAMRRALSETVAHHGASLFGSTLDDLQAALRTYSTKERFAHLSQRFFGDFLSRILRSYVDREIPNLVGVSPGLTSVGDSREAIDAIDRHARESSLILRDYAGGWYSKHNWESRGEISLEETRAFVAYALRKMRDELKREATR